MSLYIKTKNLMFPVTGEESVISGYDEVWEEGVMMMMMTAKYRGETI